jgi:hypothetical protein
MSRNESRSNKISVPYAKATNQYNAAQTSVFKGYMFDVISPSNEFQWNGKGTILFDCNGTQIEFKGDFILFDRFLDFDFVASKNQKQFICWNRLPTRRKFSVSLFAEMIYHYGVNDSSEDDALVEAYDYLEKYKIIHQNNNNSGYCQVSYDLKALSKSSFVEERVNPNSIYFYISDFLQLAQIYPSKLNDIKKLTSWQRTKICQIYREDIESLCYPQSSDLSFNPLGTISQYYLSKCYRMRKLDSNQYKHSIKRVWYYEQFILKRYLTTADNNSSTRVLLKSSELNDIQKNTFYKSLFVDKKVLRLEKMPVSDHKIEYLSSSSSSSSSSVNSSTELVYANYLIDSCSIRNCEIITDRLGSIKNKTNNMPPLHVMKKQYFFRLKSKTHDLYIEAFGTNGDDFSGDDNQYNDDYDDDKDDFTEFKPWENFQRVTFSKSEKQQLSKNLHKHQWKAVSSTFDQPLVLITGGPGRGKTSAVLVNIWKARPLEYLIVAPTGIAVDRIVKQIEKSVAKSDCKPCCEQRAETIEYVVELLRHNPKHLISYTTSLIIDEASCIDEAKFAELLNCLPYLQQLIMIGDVDQIAPIGKGYPFRDMLNTLKDCSIRLTKNFRTDSRALIDNAETILSGKFTNFKFRFKLDPQRITHTTLLERTEDLRKDVLSITKYIESSDEKSQHQIQFITPYNNTRKQICQILYCHWFNFEQNSSLRHFHVGQRVMFLKNYKSTTIRYGYVSDAVKNGETGIIVSIYDIKMKNNKKPNVQEKITYKNTHRVGITPKPGYRRWIAVKTVSGQFKRIDLISIQNTVTDASCITGHKSQGSEYPYVVIVLDYFSKKSRHIVNRNWAYTSYTRSQKAVFVLYTNQTVSSSINGNNKKLGSFVEVVNTPRPPIDTFLWLYLKQLNGDDKFSLKKSSYSSTSNLMSDDDNNENQYNSDSSEYDDLF